MNESDARTYFEKRLVGHELFGGSNFLVDDCDVIWECMVFADGEGIAYIERHANDGGERYHLARRYALERKDTVFRSRS